MEINPITVGRLYKLAIKMSKVNNKSVKRNLEILLSTMPAHGNARNNNIQ
jgi:hypothetical protein